MNQPIHDDELNRILLKPRFKIPFDETKEELIERFRRRLSREECIYTSKIIDHHIVIDVPKEDEHFWSPQLHVEIEEENDKTIVKGILGPKPKIWTFFIFLHFAVVLIFLVFFVIFYAKYTLDQDYELAGVICLLMPVVWVALYFFGQLGKKFGYKQMVGLHDFLVRTLRQHKD